MTLFVSLSRPANEGVTVDAPLGRKGIIMTPWELKGREFVNCTCEYGCNCQFNALPDKGHCHAVGGIQIEQGYYGTTRLDGLRIATIFKWPGPVHEGNGESISFVDE